VILGDGPCDLVAVAADRLRERQPVRPVPAAVEEAGTDSVL
jgi:hypothetical protein